MQLISEVTDKFHYVFTCTEMTCILFVLKKYYAGQQTIIQYTIANQTPAEENSW